MKDAFLAAIHSMTKLAVTFHSKQDGMALRRVCAPMDFGPSRRARDQSDRFHLWDYESDEAPHVLSLRIEQVMGMETLVESFDPGEFVTWSPQWIVTRNWGTFS